MDKFRFETQGTNTYIVYEISESEMLDSMTLGMITNNKIPGLAQAFFFQQDNAKFVKYNISSKVSAEQFLMGAVNKKRLIGVFKGIVNAMISAEEYMIDLSSLCLDLEYIYTDVSTCETVVICLPVTDLEKPIIDLKGFFKNIVFSTQFDQTENGDYIAKLINYLNSASVFSLYDFKDVLDVIEHGVKTGQETTSSIQQPVIQQSVIPQEQSVIQQPSAQNVKSQQVARPEPIVETAPLQDAPINKSVVQKTEMPKKSEAPLGLGFAIPEKNVQQLPIQKMSSEQQDEVPTKEISWLYLMQHYNKENAAIYKAQQEAKKAAKATAAPEKKNKKEKKEKKSKEPAPSAMEVAFAIPGQTEESAETMTGNPVRIPTSVQQPAKQMIPIQENQPEFVCVLPAPKEMVQSSTTLHSQGSEIQNAPFSQPASRPANFGETTVLSPVGIGETAVLDTAVLKQEIKPYLIRCKNNEKIMVDKPVFRIGKERSYVDYFIGDNPAISRSHANIIERDGNYFITDTNSTNHTYVNGGMLQSHVETQISHGTKLRFGNEDFEFKLY